MKLPQLSLRDLFWLVALVAMGCGWWVDRSIVKEYEQRRSESLQSAVMGQDDRIKALESHIAEYEPKFVAQSVEVMKRSTAARGKANDRGEHAVKELMRITAEAEAEGIPMRNANANLVSEFLRRAEIHWGDACAWYDEQVSGKTAKEFVEAWGGNLGPARNP